MKQYVVDAFAARVFEGNPAAVCVMEQWLPDETLALITRENNLSETAFCVPEENGWRLRWLTPGGEIDLCGHATLGTAYVLSRFYAPERSVFEFETLSGRLSVLRSGERFEMDFPAYSLRQVPVTDAMAQAIGSRPKEAWLGRDLLCVMGSESEVRQAKPSMALVSALDGLLLHITAKSEDPAQDCVSRSFAPKLSVPEDPVCGSGHCHIFPYWAERLGRNVLTGYQASARGGLLYGTVADGRVKLGGTAVLFSEAEIRIA